MSLISDLTAAREGAAAKLAAALSGNYASSEEFKPDASGPGSLNRTAYIRELRETIKDLTEQIVQAQDDEDGPVCNERRIVPV